MFDIVLPATSESASAPLGTAPASTTEARGHETVLVVEDEPQVRAIAQRMLEGSGYRALVAADAEEAIAASARHPERIHLLPTDVVMPGMNGRALAEQLLAARTGLRAIFMSGHSDAVLVDRGVLAAGFVLVDKPFTRASPLSAVRRALDRT